MQVSAQVICTLNTEVVPRAVPGITVGHEMVGIVESVGSAVTHVKPGDRVTVNVEPFVVNVFSVKKVM